MTTKQTHPTFGYRISSTTGKRLPSKKQLHSAIKHTEWKLEQLKKQLLEHLNVEVN